MITNRMVSKALASLIFGVMVGVFGLSATTTDPQWFQECEEGAKCEGLTYYAKVCDSSIASCVGVNDTATFNRCKKSEKKEPGCDEDTESWHHCKGNCNNKSGSFACCFDVFSCITKKTGGNE